MKLSCALAPCLASPEHARIAEALGYERVWLYDSPALYLDVWMIALRAAERTTRIGLGPAVLIPSLRHPMATAAAISTLCEAAPGRVAVAIGSGFTGRYTFGQRPMKWSDVETYVVALRGLLRGETVAWEGAPLRMLHNPGFGAPRPIDVPFYLGAEGPKGSAVAARVGDGVFAGVRPNPNAPAGQPHLLLQFGTVLDEGEDLRSDRVLAAAGPALAVVYHAIYERAGADGLRALPGGEAFWKGIEGIPERERHLAIHEAHLVGLAAIDEAPVREGADLIPSLTFSGTPEQLRERVAALERDGGTELVYQPAGPDIPRELERMRAAIG